MKCSDDFNCSTFVTELVCAGVAANRSRGKLRTLLAMVFTTSQGTSEVCAHEGGHLQ